MIPAFIEAFKRAEPKISAVFAEKHPENYFALLTEVVRHLPGLDADRIHEIDDGEYQGTLVYVIGAEGYQPNDYWYTKVWYGSCSGCDTLQAISGYSDNPPNPQQVKDYMTLALHMVEAMHKMGDDAA